MVSAPEFTQQVIHSDKIEHKKTVSLISEAHRFYFGTYYTAPFGLTGSDVQFVASGSGAGIDTGNQSQHGIQRYHRAAAIADKRHGDAR